MFEILQKIHHLVVHMVSNNKRVIFKPTNKFYTWIAVILIVLSLSATLFIDLAEVQVLMWITLLCGEYLGFSRIITSKEKDNTFIVLLVLEIVNTGTFYTLHKVYPLQIVTIVNAVITVLFGLYCIYTKRKP